jgi:NTP pyrophosphatase (non-canonical NTP hydrolase)
MDFDEYQSRAKITDVNPEDETAHDWRSPERGHVIPMLGLAGEVGGLLSQYKKLLRDGEVHRGFRAQVQEELGDILWYVANVASKFDLSLDDVAEANLRKTRDRWGNVATSTLFDEDCPSEQQLPRTFQFRLKPESVDGIAKVLVSDMSSGTLVGDPLTSNAYDEDGYRFHDVLHMALAARLGWSPVLRKLLRKRRKLQNRQPSIVDEVEDGGRAQVVEEAIVAAAYAYAADHDYLAGIDSLDEDLLSHIKRMTAGLEVSSRTTGEWNDAILAGFGVWRALREHSGGVVTGDLRARSIVFCGSLVD